jgi:hypothetical protein
VRNGARLETHGAPRRAPGEQPLVDADEERAAARDALGAVGGIGEQDARSLADDWVGGDVAAGGERDERQGGREAAQLSAYVFSCSRMTSSVTPTPM